MFNLASRAKPYFGALVLSVALLTAGGVYSALRMPSGVYPEVTFPRLGVRALKPGLAVANMEVQVTRPLEDAMGSVIGVERVRSKTIRGGCDLSVDLAPGTDPERAELLAWSQIGAIRSQLPPDVDLRVERMTPAVFPMLSVVLTGGNSQADLRDYALFQLVPLIKQIPDVYKAEVTGGDLKEITVEARPEALLAAGLSAADLADQIGKVHRFQPVGRVEGKPQAFQILMDTQGEAARAKDKDKKKSSAEIQREIIRSLEELVVSGTNNQPLRVRDVAKVRALYQDRVHSVGSGGKPAVVITISRRKDGNTVTISQGVHALLKQHTFPANIRAAVAYDQAEFVNTAVDNVRDAILIGGLFSILILLAFLRSWRATLISALAIPTTLAITFLFLHWQGGTLNLMSLGGLAVAIGLIIDDTVVVIENIARHLQAPKPGDRNPASSPSRNGQPRDAVDAASSEITGAVVGSTLTTVLVFVPLAFIAGVYGQFFASLSWALCIAVLVSMVISLTLVPVFAAKFLAGRPMPEPGPIYNLLANGYERLLAVALRFPYVTVAASLGAIGVGIILYTGIPGPKEDGKRGTPIVRALDTGLMPSMDEGAFVVDYIAPAGTPLERTEDMARTIEHLLSENPDVQIYVRRTGAELGLFATRTNRGDIQVMLRPAENDPVSLLHKPVRPPFKLLDKEGKEDGELIRLGKEAAKQKYGPKFTEKQMWAEGKAAIRKKYRRRSLADIKKEIEEELEEHFHPHQMEGEIIQVMQDELNDLSGADRPIEVKLFGPDHNKLRELAKETAEMLEKEGKPKGIKEIISNVEAGNPDLMIQLNQLRATRLGLNPQEVERQLRAIYLGQVATQVRESAERITDVRVRYPDALRFGSGHFRPDKVLSPLLLLPHGGPAAPAEVSLAGLARSVPASALARVEPVRTPEQQVRENLQPAVIITAEIDESKTSLGKAAQDIKELMTANMEKKLKAEGCRWDMGGHYIKQREAFFSLTVVMVVAILLVYIMLAFQLRSVVLPLLIFLTQPLSLVSGLFALWLTHTPLNMSSYMGAILLIGLDMKNGILLVEYIQQLRAEGMALRPALLLAGRTRFRPILMTSLAAILGLFPLALGIGPGAQMQQPLAIMVIGGLTANMLFTRLIIPAGYLLFERWKPEPPPAVALVSVPAPVAVVTEERVVPST